jgi:hypothetical protein
MGGAPARRARSPSASAPLPGSGARRYVLPKEGYGIVPGTVLFGIGIAVAGWLSRSPRD